MEPGKAMDIGRKTAYKVGVAKYGKAGMTRKAIAGRKAAESYSADRFVDSLNEAHQHAYLLRVSANLRYRWHTSRCRIRYEEVISCLELMRGIPTELVYHFVLIT